MHYLSKASGIGALRLLALSSALLLAACGGGGGSEATTEQPAPVAKRVPITAENQQEVAMHAGGSVSLMGPLAIGVGQMLIGQLPEAGNQNLLRSGTPQVAPQLSTNTPAGALAATIAKIRAAKPAAPLALAKDTTWTTTETYDVACVTGSGKVTFSQSETEGSTSNSYTQTAKAVLTNCQLDYDSEEAPAVVANGSVNFDMSSTYAAESSTSKGNLEVAGFSLKTADFEITLEGDMHLEGNDQGYVSTGNRFALSFTGELNLGGPVELAAAEPEVQSITLAMTNYRQELKLGEAGYTVTSQATVETSMFGEKAVYDLSTPVALTYDGEMGSIVAGKIKIAGAEGTLLWIAADGEGTFTLQRDDKGDGSIDGEVQGLTQGDLLLFFLPFGLPT